MKNILLTCSLALCATLPAFAADNPWVGTWKLDMAKSHLTGDTFTYSRTADGMLRYDDGGPSPNNFAIDGKEYRISEDATTSWTASGQNAWDSVKRKKGAIISKAHRTLSSDGKTYTIHWTSYLPDGTTSTGSSIYTRVSGTSGLEGTWRSSKIEDSAPDVYTVTEKEGNILHWDTPAYRETVEGKPDGSDLTPTGPMAMADLTIAYKTISPTSMTYTVKIKGQPAYYGEQTLSSDGKSLTDTSWTVGKENEKTTSYYARQ